MTMERTQEMKLRITEDALQGYYFDMDDWLVRKKTINQANVLKNKAGMVAMIEADYQNCLADDLDVLAEDFAVALETLKAMSEEEFADMRKEILTWAPSRNLL